MLAESVNHCSMSDLQLDFCGVIVERDRRIVQSDVSGVLDSLSAVLHAYCLQEVAVFFSGGGGGVAVRG